MKRFEPVPEPETFDREVRQKGNALLMTPAGSVGRPKNLWSRFLPELSAGFHDLCAYSAMYTPDGTVDHFVSISEDRRLAYEWSNYRYVGSRMNSKKGALPSAKLLDPFAVEDDWFEVLLPSLQLVVTARMPAHLREKANTLIQRLGLRDDEPIIRQRRAWLAQYEKKHVTLEGLECFAPLIARAVRKREGNEANAIK